MDKRSIGATNLYAHQLFAHPGSQVLDFLNNNVKGIVLPEKKSRGPAFQECNTCIKTKLHNIKSRRQAPEHPAGLFERVGIDLIEISPRGTVFYNGDGYMVHAYYLYSNSIYPSSYLRKVVNI